MDKTTHQFLSIKYPDILKELQTHELNATAQTSILAPVGKEKYIAALATAGKGMHIDALVEAVHGIKPGTPLFLPNKKRTGTWLNQNSSDTVRKGVAGVVEKVDVIEGKATPATYKLTDEALAVFMASQPEEDEEQTGSEALESMPSDAPVVPAKTVAPAKKTTGKKETANA